MHGELNNGLKMPWAQDDSNFPFQVHTLSTQAFVHFLNLTFFMIHE